jgi:hypothetical protein
LQCYQNGCILLQAFCVDPAALSPVCHAFIKLTLLVTWHSS